MKNQKISSFALSVLGLLLMSACGKSTGNVSLGNQPFNTSGVASRFNAYYVASNSLIPSIPAAPSAVLGVTPTTTVQDFKVCVGSITLENENDEAQQGDSGESEIQYKPGLIDLTSGAISPWGQAKVPVGFKLSRLVIKAKLDPAACQNVNYSVKFNQFTTTSDIAFKWKFNPPVDLKDGSSLKVALGTVVGKFRLAVDGGTLNAQSLKSLVEGIEDSAAEDPN